MSGLFLGIDGGQSSTTAWIGDATGRVLGAGTAGPCNHVGAAEGRARFTGSVRGCLQAACDNAGLDAGAVEFESACLGFSGGPADKDALVRELVRARAIAVTHDGVIALSGATAGGPGVIVIAGTGSIAYGRNAAGETARAGGWGYIHGDEGGAFDIVRQALRAALRQEEGWGPPTALHTALLAATGASNANDLLHRFYTDDYRRDRVATLAPIVELCASLRDAVALDILDRCGQQLAALAEAARGQIFDDGAPVTVCPIGGVFGNGVIRDRFSAVAELTAGVTVRERLFGPAAGALLEAYRIAGVSVELREPPE